MENVKDYEGFTSESIHNNKMKNKLYETVVNLLDAITRRERDKLPVSHYGFSDYDMAEIMIEIDCHEWLQGEFSFTVSPKSGKYKDWKNKQFSLEDIYIHIPLLDGPMRIYFSGQFNYEDGDIDGDDFSFEDIVEQEELIDFIKP